jgi:hypothetical protein
MGSEQVATLNPSDPFEWFEWRDGLPYCKKHGTRLLGRLGTTAGGGMYCLECAGQGQQITEQIAVGTPFAYLSQRTYEQGYADGDKASYERGMREMAEAACRAQCAGCFNPYFHVGRRADETYWHFQVNNPAAGKAWPCRATTTRRAAATMGVKMDAAPDRSK